MLLYDKDNNCRRFGEWCVFVLYDSCLSQSAFVFAGGGTSRCGLMGALLLFPYSFCIQLFVQGAVSRQQLNVHLVLA